jgi:peptidoglycan/xylan/chitin deacetylase (PgdA/CDA1 family)
MNVRRRDLLRSGVVGFSIGLVAPAFAASLQPSDRPAWPNGAKAAVSLTYDDGLDSQLDNALPALQRCDVKATFFLTKVNVEARLGDWRAVGESGHEIGDHTVSHPCRLGSVAPAAFDRREIEGMEQFLASNFDKGRVPIFAYPCGVLDLGKGSELQEQVRYVHMLEKYFVAARTVAGAPNDPRQVRLHRYVLQAFEPTYDRDDPARAIDYVRSAMARGNWAILVFHEVIPKRLGAGDTSLRTHEAILQWLRSAPVWCAPMGEVLRHLGMMGA